MVTYDVSLMKPRINPNVEVSFAHITELPTGSATAAAPLGTTGGVLSTTSSFPGVAPYSTTSITLANPGNYLVIAGWSGSSIGGAGTIAYGSNVANGPKILGDAVGSIRSAYTSTVAQLTQVVTVSAYGTGSANAVSFTGLSGMSAASLDIFVYQLPATVN